MNKELEALLLCAAKALGLGVVGVSVERAADFGVPLGMFVRQGAPLPGDVTKKARWNGYYCCRRADRKKVPDRMLFVDPVDHGDGTGHYSLFMLSEPSTGYGSFVGQNRAFSLREIKAYLRGVADGAEFLRKDRST